MNAKLRSLTYRHQDWILPGILAVGTVAIFAASTQERIAKVSAWTLANANWVGAALLVATTVGLILMGTTTAKRAGGCLVQGCIFIALMKANMPAERKTDGGQFVDAMTKTHGERLAVIIERKQQEKVDALQYAADR